MTAPPGKIPVLLTAIQVDLIGEALVEQISYLADRLSKAPQKEIAREEVSLLNAYLELAKVIMDGNGIRGSGEATGISGVRLPRGRTDGPSPLQNPALKLRQP